MHNVGSGITRNSRGGSLTNGCSFRSVRQRYALAKAAKTHGNVAGASPLLINRGVLICGGGEGERCIAPSSGVGLARQGKSESTHSARQTATFRTRQHISGGIQYKHQAQLLKHQALKKMQYLLAGSCLSTGPPSPRQSLAISMEQKKPQILQSRQQVLHQLHVARLIFWFASWY
jgi:hypothetical protein